MNGFFHKAQQAREALRVATPTRIISVFAGGTLGQRTVLLMGLTAMVFAVFKSLIWVALAVAGWVLCYFAVRDYEKTQDL